MERPKRGWLAGLAVLLLLAVTAFAAALVLMHTLPGRQQQLEAERARLEVLQQENRQAADALAELQQQTQAQRAQNESGQAQLEEAQRALEEMAEKYGPLEEDAG